MKTIRFTSLGCPKNLVDSEVMLAQLRQAGFVIVPDNQPADIFLVNTCCFIKEATDEAEGIIRQAVNLKKAGQYRKVIVAGCLPQRIKSPQNLPYGKEVDGWVGVFGRDQIADLCRQLDNDTLPPLIPVIPARARPDTQRLRLTSRHYAYLKIAEGCDNRCTYCVIPHLHGPYRSKPIKTILKEAAALARDGVKELNLIAQDTTSYGLDLTGKHQLARLLRKLSTLPGIAWIRLLYTHPRHFTEELIEEISCNNKVVKYIDLPVQHISDNILRGMGRGIRGQEIRKVITRLRQRIPGLFLRTSLIVGFPGETAADFRELWEFVRQTRFERLGVFKYSAETGTPAARLRGQVPEKVKDKRLDVIMQTQQAIAFEFNRSLKGKSLPVIIDRREGQKTVGRTYGDAPEVDGNIFVSGKGVTAGGIYQVMVTGYRNYDLVGRKYEST